MTKKHIGYALVLVAVARFAYERGYWKANTTAGGTFSSAGNFMAGFGDKGATPVTVILAGVGGYLIWKG